MFRSICMKKEVISGTRGGVSRIAGRQARTRTNQTSPTRPTKRLTYSTTLCRLSSMGTRPTLSFQGLAVLNYLLNDPTSEFTGADIIRSCGLASGTIYPLLLRFERGGLVESHWEEGAPSELGRPRRRFYRITANGMAAAQRSMQNLARPSAMSASPASDYRSNTVMEPKAV